MNPNGHTKHLHLHPQVTKIFKTLLQFPEGSQLYCNSLDPCVEAVQYLADCNAKVTALVKDPKKATKIAAVYGDSSMDLTESENPERFAPKDQYHLAFGFYPFQFNLDENIPEKEQVQFPQVEDDLLLWKVSEGGLGDNTTQRVAPAHLIGLEGLMKSVILGGYFASVLPPRWLGRKMQYMRWWTDRAALVARIQLPPEAVTLSWQDDPYVYPGSTDLSEERITVPAPSGKASKGWELYIWHRPVRANQDMSEAMTETPNSCRQNQKLPHAEFRYAPFLFPLETLKNESINTCMRAFLQSDWWINSVKLHNKMLNENRNHPWCTLAKPYPYGLKELKNAWFFKPSPAHQMKIQVVPTVEDMKRIPHAVHVKVGSRIKLTPGPAETWTRQKPTTKISSQFGLLDLRHQEGLYQSEDGGWEFTYNAALRRTTFHEIREKLVADIIQAGLTPCMTQTDAHRMRKKERWLSIQLTPLERMVPIANESEEKQSVDEASWEILYEDIGMASIHPELIALWRKRALKMNLHTILFDFQFEDVIRMAAKSSLINSNVMGLGKTRETLCCMLLRGSKKNLIVAPNKLIGEWQDEIQNTLVPYMRKQRRNWQGQIMDPSMHLITQGRDCLKENLATFNLISYDKLKTTPQDGKFYQCPECKTVVYSAFPEQRMGALGTPYEVAPKCPGDPYQLADPNGRIHTCSHRIKKWRQDNREMGRSKHKVVCDVVTGEPLRNEEGQYIKRHWKKFPVETLENPKIPVEAMPVKIIDTRPPKPTIPTMVELDHMYKKMETIQVGWEENQQTGERKPILKQVERDFHVKWTFSELLRGKFNVIAADEALYFVNMETKRSQAIYHLTATTKWPLTGTPVKGYPQDVLPLINWTIGREAFPDYRSYDPGGQRRFMEKYKTEVMVDGVMTEDGQMVGGRKKLLPKVSNPELFQAELAPFLLRHTRNEPQVVRDIPRKKLMVENLRVPMDQAHRIYYEKWLQSFAEWWESMKAEEEGKAVKANLLVKMNYLFSASINPHHMMDEILKGKDDVVKAWASKIGKYKGPLTAKMKKCFELVRHHVAAGDKTLVFSSRQRNSDSGLVWSKAAKLNGMVVDGRTSLNVKAGETRSERHNMVQAFRTQDYHVMWAGIGALAEGVNIPEANRGIILDPSWKPSDARQSIGRMIRPQQEKVVYSTFLMHKGSIEEYMAAVCYLKGRSGDETVDYMEFSDFSTALIPDIKQYADWIVDGTEDREKAKMWLAVDFLRKKAEEEGDEGL